jgi:hypothetical protein
MSTAFANKPVTAPAAEVDSVNSPGAEAPKEQITVRERREFDHCSIDLKRYEQIRIINPDSLHGQAFQRDCQALVARMYPGYDFEKKPVAFVLFESKDPNAFFDCHSASIPLIGVSTSFFRASFRDGKKLEPLLSSVDALAAVLAHEWKHYQIRGMDNNEAPTKIEEAQCQYESVVALLDAGLDPRAELKLSEELAARYPTKKENTWAAAYDEHLMPLDAVRFVEAALTKLSEERGGFPGRSEASIMADSDLYRAATTARHSSWLDEVLERMPFRSASLPAKVEIVQSIIDRGEWAKFPWRGRNIAQTISSLPLEGAEDKDLMRKLAAVIFDAATVHPVETSGAITGMYSALYKAYKGQESGAPKPLSRLVRLNAALDNFIQASDADDIVSAAQRVMGLLKKEPLLRTEAGRALLESLQWKEFALPRVPANERRSIGSKKQFREDSDYAYTEHVTFENHVGCARKHGEPVTTILALLGISEPRLIAQNMMSSRTAHGIQKKELPCLAKNTWERHIEAYYEQLCSPKIVNSSTCIEDYVQQLKGERITALATVSGDFVRDPKVPLWDEYADDEEGASNSDDKQQMKRRISKPLIPSEQWKSLAKDPVGFIRSFKNQLILSPPDLVRFTGELTNLYSSVPAQHRELLRSIFQPLTSEQPAASQSPERGLFFTLMQAEEHDISALDPRRNPLVRLLHNLPDSCLTPSEKLSTLGALFSPEHSPLFYILFREQLASSRLNMIINVAPIAIEAFPTIFGGPNLSSWAAAIKAAKTINSEAPLALPFLHCELMNLAAATKPKLNEVLELARVIDLNFHPSFLLDLYGAFPREKFEEQLSRLPLQDALERWHELHASSFPPLDVTYSYLKPLLERLEREDPRVQLEEAQKLLTIQPSYARTEVDTEDDWDYSGLVLARQFETPRVTVQIEEPRLRLKCLGLVARSFAEAHGADDASHDYQDKALQLVRYLKRGLNRLDQATLLIKLDHETCSQRELSYALEAELPKIQTFEGDNHRKCAGVELLLAISKNHPHLQDAVVDLIVSDGGAEAVKTFEARMPEGLMETFLGRGGSAFSDSFADLSNRNSPDDQQSEELNRDLDRAHTIMVHEQREQMRLAYLHFWSLPIEARAVFTRELLPDATDQQTGASSVPTCFEAVATRMFPPTKEHATEARTWLRDYISVIPDYQRGLMLSSCLIAAQRGSANDLPVGEVLAILLENLGPGPIKAGQGGSCHPDLPEHLQKPLRRLKYSADQRPRWECHHWIDERLPAERRAGIVHVGPILGQASLWVTLRITRQMDDSAEQVHRVISLLRPYAQQRLEYGCDTLTRLANRIENPKASRITAQLVAEALRSGLLEINSTDAQLRHAAAKEQYEREVVIVDGEKFAFTAASVIEAGEGYKEMNEIPGRHVADVVSDETVDEKRRERLAMAIFTREVNFILRGLPFCNDRHGGNDKEQDSTVGHFDLGSFELGSPKEEDMQHLAGLILRLGTSFATGGSASELAGTIDEHTQTLQRERGKASPFLMRVQKAFLSLGDCMAVLSKESCLECLAAAASYNMHPYLTNALLQEVMTHPELASALSGLNTSGRVSIAPAASACTW